MDPRLGPDEFMEQLLAAHQAEDAFVPQPEDTDREGPEGPAVQVPVVGERR